MNAKRWFGGAVALTVAAAMVFALAAPVAGAVAVSAPVPAGGLRPEEPAVSGNRVVWSDYADGRYDLWLYDGTTKQATKIAATMPGDKVQPAISGDTVVFVAFSRATGGDVFAYDIPSGVIRPLTQAAGDQANPTISGRFVAWEDYSSGYSAKINGYNLETGAPLYIDSSYSSHKRRPQAAGDFLLYESSATQDKTDIYAYNFVTGFKAPIANGAYEEIMPATDGTWAAWVQPSATGYDVWAGRLGLDASGYPTLSEKAAVTTDPGEQTLPAVGNGVVYYTDAAAGLVVRSYNPATGARSTAPLRTRGAVRGFVANGDALAWIEPNKGDTWQVKALFGAPVPTFTIASILPGGPAWSALRFAMLPVHSDYEPPAAMYSSVTPGQTGVSPTGAITVTFSEDMDPATVNGGTVKLVDASGKAVAARVRYSSINHAAVIKPIAPLKGAYTLKVASSVSDIAGNAANASYVLPFSTVGTFQAAGIYAPNIVDGTIARVVNASGDVKLTWKPGSDSDGQVKGYYVKRYSLVVTSAAAYSAASTLTPIGAGSAFIASPALEATFSAATTETTARSSYYYLVVASDNDSMTSQGWLNACPNPHGTMVVGGSTNSCMRCHTTHGGIIAGPGALGARGAQGCYKCHGSTTAATGFGYASRYNIQGQFWDYGTDPMPSTGSRHGNSFIRAQNDNQQCDMCHSPHKKSYDPNKAKSYGKLLWSPSTPTSVSSSPTTLSTSIPDSAKVYSTDSTPVAESFCFNCHGGTSSYNETPTASSPYSMMYVFGGPTAYDAAAGDHNQSAWATTTVAAMAHGSANLTDALRPGENPPNGGSVPENDCQVCHNEHGSQSKALLAYRRSANTTNLATGGLCLECHATSGEGAEETRAPGARPYTWNGRSIKTEFSRTGSHHPTDTTGGYYGPVTSLATPGTIDSQSDFMTWATPTNVSFALTPGSAVLNSQLCTYTVAGYPSGTGRFDSTYNGESWNRDFDPTDNGTNFATGGNSTTRSDNYLFAMLGNSTTMRVYTPPTNGSGTGTWAAATNSWQTAAAGSDMAYDSAHNYVWALVGGWAVPSSASSNGTNIRRSTAQTGTALTWYAPGTYDGPIFRVGGTNQALGAGSTLAWVPANGTRLERLYVVNRYGTTTRDGLLYYYDSPDAAVGGTNWTSTTHVLGTTGTTSDTGSRMTYFRIGTTDYLYYMRGASTTAYLVTLANTTAAAGTLTTLTNPFGGNIGEGCSLSWNGDTSQSGFRLYAIRGGNNTVAMQVATWNGSALVWSAGPTTGAASTGGSWLGQLKADAGSRHVSAGTMTIPNITKASGDTGWNKVTVSASVPANSTLTLNVRDGSTHADLLGSQNLTGDTTIDLSSLSNTSLEYLFTYSSTATSATPEVRAVNTYSSKIGWIIAGSSSCYSCHNTHYVGEGSGSSWDTSRVSNPLDTNSRANLTVTQFCINCHSGSAADGSIVIPAVTNSYSTLIPYTIQMRVTTSWPFFNGWSKSGFTGSGHYTATVANGQALCQNCHDPHASDFPALVAWSRPASATITGGNNRTRDNTTVAYVKEENLCLQCHGDGTTANKGKAAGALDIFTPFNSGSYSAHPTIATADKHSDRESAADLLSKRHAECVDCHDPHAAVGSTDSTVSSTANLALKGASAVIPSYGSTVWTAPSSWVTTRLAGTTASYEGYVCLKCHSSYIPGWATGSPTVPSSVASGGAVTFKETDLATEFNPNNFSGHNAFGDAYTKAVTSGGFTWGKPTATTLGLLSGWSVDSTMKCSDCHNYSGTGANGPHGSANKYILKWGGKGHWWDNTVTTSAWSSSTNFCGGCHTGTGTHPWLGQAGEHARKCNHCHIVIPHGWKRPRLLRGQDEYQIGAGVSPYVVPDSAGDTWRGITLMAITDQVPNTEGDCGDGCDTGKHPVTKTTW